MEDKMKRLLLAAFVTAAFSLSACGAFARHSAQTMIAPAEPGLPAVAGGNVVQSVPQPELGVPGPVPAFQDNAAKSAPAGVANAGEAAPSSDRLVVQTAELTIVVNDVNARVNALEQMAKTMGGYVVSVNVGQTYAPDGTLAPQAQIVFRVPADQLDAALAQVKDGTVSVQDETRAGQDVTNAYVDLQSRLTAKQAAADQLTKIMQSATKTQDVLDVYQQLQQVDSDIEVLKGQIQYYQESAQLSAITVHVVAEATVKPIEVGGWKPQGVARDAIQSLIYFWQDFADVMINFFLYLLPVLITLAIPLFLLFLLVRWLFRRVFKTRLKTEAPKA
jgi:hypothetical protein